MRSWKSSRSGPKSRPYVTKLFHANQAAASRLARRSCATGCRQPVRVQPRSSQIVASHARISFIAFFTFHFSFLIFNSSAAEPDPKPLFTILYTAEAHAALLPCDCPLEPLGGVGRRATLIKRYRERGPILLIDGGGWAAGGMYDEDSDGDPERDRLR